MGISISDVQQLLANCENEADKVSGQLHEMELQIDRKTERLHELQIIIFAAKEALAKVDRA